jgi:arylsulfatase A-like enzyme
VTRERRLLLISALLSTLAAAAYWVRSAPESPPLPPAIHAPPATAAERGKTSVVVVIACTLRADEITPYGGPEGVTPFLEERARLGTKFAETIAQAPWTRPALTAILTGHHPIDVGMVDPAPGPDKVALETRVTTLAERFQAAGYRTGGATANPNGNAVFGFSQGFDHYFEPTDDWQRGFTKVTGRMLLDDALRWAGEAESPFYLQLLLVDAHRPYRLGHAWKDWEDGAPSRTVAEYRSMLHELDATLRELHEGLAERGWTDENTTFLVVGDHGEGNWQPEHHGKGHGNFLFESSVHVPWLMWGAGVARAHTVEGLSAQLDVVPTLMGLYGLGEDAALEGHDWSGRLAGDPAPTGVERVFTDTWFRRSSRAAVYTPTRFCQQDFAHTVSLSKATGRKKTPTFTPGCFDRASDPEALRVIDDPALLGEVDAWRAEHEARNAAWIAGGTGAEAEIDETTRKILEGLGYME